MPRVLGIDPGTVAMGYGVVEVASDVSSVLASGVFAAPEKFPLPQRLHLLYQQLQEAITRYQPTELAVEEPFTAKNPRSALAVGQALALALLAAADHDLPVHTYPPARVKQAVTNYGRSTKDQVRAMVCLRLGAASDLPEHAADALAIALCHLQERRLAARLAGEWPASPATLRATP
ncbi:MAG: crossover junction endodeoxyribonuclease RuvC [Chloroflexi bacterium]|nr:crossover junction endodeoxyribonuclease RuvC [Chloroflexota bacterium]